MTPLTRVAHAKINLALHVRRRRPDGYHELETLFAFAEDGDRLTVSPAPALSLEIAGPYAADISTDDNLVLRAAEALRRHDARLGARIVLEKNLPVASGLGGGSADAAAALLLLRMVWSLPIDDDTLAAIGLGLGADVPACLRSETCRGEGVGERLSPVFPGALAGMPVLLVNPNLPVSTGAVFKSWDDIDHGPLDLGDPLIAAANGRNDLEPPAIALQPVIETVLETLAEDRPLLARMSGSGATCFGLYGSVEARDRARDRISRSRPGWWVLASRLR